VPLAALAKAHSPFAGPRSRNWGLLLGACARGNFHERSLTLSAVHGYRKITEVMEESYGRYKY